MIAEGVLCFGLTPEQVGLLTYREFNNMMEAYNEQKKNEYEMQRNVILNAIINSKRKQYTPVIPLFKDDDEMTDEEKLKEREELFGK